VKYWQRLLEAPDVAARRFAVEKLRDVPSTEIAQALLAELHHPDRGLRDEALAALRGAPAGRQALCEALLDAASPEHAWFLARAQAVTVKQLPRPLKEKLLKQAFAYQEAEDRRAEPFWFLLHEIDPEGTKAQLEERALALRKKKDYAGSLGYWRLLVRDPACGPDVRFELAATGLKTSARDTSTAARHADPALVQFTRLLQEPAFDLIGRVSKAKWLDADDLFYLGFHFTGENRQAKEFGKAVLELLIKRSPRSELAKNARRKLKSEGLA
jgi:hypothetical protein